MAKLSAKQRKSLPKQDFAMQSKAGTAQGKAQGGSYPIPDENHAKNALARSAGKPVAGKVKTAVKKKYPNMKMTGAKTKMNNPSVKKSVANIKKRLTTHSKNKTEIGF